MPGGDDEGLCGVIAARAGAHPRFAPPELPPESLLSAAVAEAEAEAEAEAAGGTTESNYSSGGQSESNGTLASDEQLAALREKLSGGA